MRLYVLTCSAALFAAQLSAQSFTTHPCTDGGSDSGGWFNHNDSLCEVRAASFPLSGDRLRVKGMNGSIEVIGDNRQDVAMEAHVQVHAPSREEAASIMHEITINTSGIVEAHGPHVSNGRNWSVSYHLRVPHRLAAELHTENGSLTLAELDGAIQAVTTNGSVKLSDLAGDVHVETTNGSLNVQLDGSTWRGKGLSAQTTNGSVAVSLPQSYSAHLIANTVNGRAAVSGMAASGGDMRHNRLDTNLGHGGPTLDFETINGSISVH